MLVIALVGFGGLVGAVSRYLVGSWVTSLTDGSGFPYGTLAVNVAGCLMIGLVAGFAETRGTLSAEARALLMIGLLGGFTTFSAFGYETVTLVRDGEVLAGVANIGLQLTLGLAALYAGLRISLAA